MSTSATRPLLEADNVSVTFPVSGGLLSKNASSVR